MYVVILNYWKIVNGSKRNTDIVRVSTNCCFSSSTTFVVGIGHWYVLCILNNYRIEYNFAYNLPEHFVLQVFRIKSEIHVFVKL